MRCLVRWSSSCAVALLLLAGSTGAVRADPGWFSGGWGPAHHLSLAASRHHDRGDQGDQGDTGDQGDGSVSSSVYGSAYGGDQGGNPPGIVQGFGGDEGSVSGSVYGDQGQQQGEGVGASVSATVHQAQAEGDLGTSLAEKIHELLSELKPQAEGLSVAEAVYESVYASAYSSVDNSVYQGVYGQTSGEGDFSDLVEVPWAAAAIHALARAGVVQGTGGQQFSPDAPVTGSELLTMLARLESWPSSSQAPGIDSGVLGSVPAYARSAVQAALAQGMLTGLPDLKVLTAGITRAQAVVLLIEALRLGSLAQTLAQAPLPLSGPVPAWAHGAFVLAYDLKLLQGVDGKALAGQVLTRAQMAVLLARFATLVASLANTSPAPSGGAAPGPGS